MITKEEFEKAVEYCTGFAVSCENCPLCEKDFKCGAYLAEYLKETELAPAATGTSSEILKISIQHTLMIAQNRIYVKHMIPQTKPVQIYSISTKECRHVSVELLISEKCTERYAAQGISLKI